MTQVLDLVPIWTLILAAAVFFYVLLDGFDLGVGMLYGFASNKRSRNTIMNSIAPIWDGNETWLVLGGLGLLAAFPTAFAVIIPAVYFPILVMLLGLVFRALHSNSGFATLKTRRSGTAPSATDRPSPRSRKASCLAHSSRVFRFATGNSRERRIHFSRPSPF